MPYALHICVIKPTMFGEQAKDALAPLLFAILKPLTPSDVRLTFIDENLVGAQSCIACDAVAITIDTFTARRGYALAADYRTQGIPVIFGGFHASLCPDEVAQHGDAVVIGDAEDTWGAVVEDLRNGALKARYVSSNDASLDEVRYDYSVYNEITTSGFMKTLTQLSFAGLTGESKTNSADVVIDSPVKPANDNKFLRSLTTGKRAKYQPLGMVQFSRGCRFTCDFCSIHAFYRKSIRTRSAAAVVETIGQLPSKVLFFTDDNLFCDPGSLDELLAALAPLKRRWVCQISMEVAADPTLLARLKNSGCIMVLMGFESLSVESLQQMGKRANLVADYEEVIANIRRAGLMLYGTFIIGYDADTAATAEALAAFAKKHGFALANFNPLIPTPGTALYARLEKEGRLLFEHWWNDPSYCYGDTAFTPAKMTPQQLAESCRMARYEFYSLRGILLRLRGVNLKGLAYIGIFLLANLVSRASIRHKQGRRLG